MHHSARHLVLATCVALTGSIAHAAPAPTDAAPRKAKHKAKAETAGPARAKHQAARKAPAHDDDDDAPSDSKSHRVASATLELGDDDGDGDADRELVDTPVRLHRPAILLDERHAWHLALGPNAWISSVDATVSVGGKSVTAGSSFFTLEHHVRYGIPLLAEARYGRFSVATDLTYGVIGLSGVKDVGPVMVALDGTAAALQVDSIGGVRVYGTDDSVFSVEARGGVRIQRTAVSATVGVGGTGGMTYDIANNGLDWLAGTRVFLRPSSRISAVGQFDIGVLGTSARTWSAAADANIRLGSHVLLSLGYRTLTVDSSYLSMVMHGPRAAIQATF